MLVLLFFIFVALSLTRISILVIDPFAAGAQYFFYPYIFLYWIIISLVAKSED